MCSVAVVVLDTLRYDTFCEHFDWLPGRRFSQAYSTTHWTIPAHASLLTGFYPSEIGVRVQSRSLDCETPTLPEVLDAEGYTSRLFSANINLVIQEGWDRGFDQVVGMGALDPATRNTLDWREFLDEADASGYERYLRAAWACLSNDVATIPSLLEGVRMARGPSYERAETIHERVRYTDFGDREFLLVNAMDMHTPYDPPEAYRSTGAARNVTIGDAFAETIAEPGALRQAYEDEAAYLSGVYRRMFAELREEFEYVITVSDHGEALGEHGMWNHGYGLYPELTHIPLVISGEGIDSGTVEETVSLLDVHRTVADIAGVETPSRGQDLLSAPAARDALVEYHGLLDSHRNLFEKKGLPEAMYDRLNTPLDGFVTAEGGYAYRTHDEGFQQAGSASVDDPEARLNALREDVTRRAVTSEETDVSSATMRRLEDLGYA